MDKIITYRDYIKLSDEIITSKNEVNYEDLEFKLVNYYSDNFDNTICDICHSRLEIVFLERNERKYDKNEYYNQVFKVYECRHCGWWKFFMNRGYGKIKNNQDLGMNDFSKTLYKGIIKSYNIGEKTIPVNILNDEILKKPELLYNIHPERFELLTRDVFSEFYKCEVHHCGKSHDGGIDLLMIISDDPILIQCKRRESPDKIEPISAIKEFIGTLFIKNVNKGIYVTTAKDFSKQTKKIIEEKINERKFERFDLINYNDFISMHNLINKDIDKPWDNLILGTYEYHAKKRIETDIYNFYKRYYDSFKGYH